MVEYEQNYQRHKDYVVITELCRYSNVYTQHSVCPLVYKRCTEENCPLFYCVNLQDCDKAADCVCDANGIY